MKLLDVLVLARVIQWKAVELSSRMSDESPENRRLVICGVDEARKAILEFSEVAHDGWIPFLSRKPDDDQECFVQEFASQVVHQARFSAYHRRFVRGSEFFDAEWWQPCFFPDPRATT